MKVISEVIRKLTVTYVQGLDPISIYLEDNGAGQGKITITCFDQSWTSYWGGMGNRTVAEFVRSCDNQYLAKNLSRIPSEVNDVKRIPKDLIKIILGKRKANELTAEQARDYYDRESYEYNNGEVGVRRISYHKITEAQKHAIKEFNL